MAKDEKELLEVKYRSPLIRTMNRDDLVLHTQALLLKIHVITGWNLPSNDDLLTVLQDQFFKKLTETYSNCNIDEIEYAFRNFGTSVKDWGKSMNLNLIDTVMNAYLAERKCISEFEERLKKPQMVDYKPTEDELINMKRELIEVRYQNFLNGSSAFSMMPEDGLAVLAYDSFCELDLFEDFRERAFESIRKTMQGNIDRYMFSKKHHLAVNEKEAMYQLKISDVKVEILAKKMALVFCFYKFKEAGFKNIYVTN